MADDLIVRDARPDDREVLVDFNIRLARETEGKALDLDVLTRGVIAALDDPGRLRYWVAEPREEPGRVIGQAAVTREWSDWRPAGSGGSRASTSIAIIEGEASSAPSTLTFEIWP